MSESGSAGDVAAAIVVTVVAVAAIIWLFAAITRTPTHLVRGRGSRRPRVLPERRVGLGFVDGAVQAALDADRPTRSGPGGRAVPAEATYDVAEVTDPRMVECPATQHDAGDDSGGDSGLDVDDD